MFKNGGTLSEMRQLSHSTKGFYANSDKKVSSLAELALKQIAKQKVSLNPGANNSDT